MTGQISYVGLPKTWVLYPIARYRLTRRQKGLRAVSTEDSWNASSKSAIDDE